jgi:hypothetical protein
LDDYKAHLDLTARLLLDATQRIHARLKSGREKDVDLLGYELAHLIYMADVTLVSERSYEELERDDLHHMAEVVLADLRDLYDRRPKTGSLYADRLLALCLCQGGAEHFVRRGQGIKDFDVWAFFHRHPSQDFPYRRRGTADFGPSKFGRHPDDGYAGRRVDVMGRSIDVEDGENEIESIRRYLREQPSSSAQHLARRPVIMIHPEAHLGDIIWDPAKESASGKRRRWKRFRRAAA